MSGYDSSGFNISGNSPVITLTGGATPTGLDLSGLGLGGSGGQCVTSVDARQFNAQCVPLGLNAKNLVQCCAEVGGQAECGSNKCYLSADKVEDWKKCYKGDWVCAGAPRREARALAVLLAIALALGLT